MCCALFPLFVCVPVQWASLVSQRFSCLACRHDARRCQLSGTFLASAASSTDRHVRIWNWAKRNDCLHVLKPQIELQLAGREGTLQLGETRKGVLVTNIIDIGKARPSSRSQEGSPT